MIKLEKAPHLLLLIKLIRFCACLTFWDQKILSSGTRIVLSIFSLYKKGTFRYLRCLSSASTLKKRVLLFFYLLYSSCFDLNLTCRVFLFMCMQVSVSQLHYHQIKPCRSYFFFFNYKLKEWLFIDPWAIIGVVTLNPFTNNFLNN